MTENPENSASAIRNIIRVSAVVIYNENGQVLNVRKRGTQMFMLPGGKPEPGEKPAETAIREAREELGIELDATDLQSLGEFEAAAANEGGFTVQAAVFAAMQPVPAHTIQPLAEIDAILWVDPQNLNDADAARLAPLTLEAVFPILPQNCETANDTPPITPP